MARVTAGELASLLQEEATPGPLCMCVAMHLTYN